MPFLFAPSLPQNSSRLMQTAIKALGLLVLSAGLLSILLMVGGEVVFSRLLGLWSSIRCLLSSPVYMCMIINSVVALIAVSSTFHRAGCDSQGCCFNDDHGVLVAESHVVPRTGNCSIASIIFTLCQVSGEDDSPHILIDGSGNYSIGKFDVSNASVSIGSTVSKTSEIKKAAESDKIEGGVTVSDQPNEQENEDDTIEATWKAITGGGKQRPKTKQLNECETWKDLRKSEWFEDAVCRGGLRRDPSIGLEELNEQVEAFIKKFNDDLRLQKQESDQRFLDMISRGP